MRNASASEDAMRLISVHPMTLEEWGGNAAFVRHQRADAAVRNIALDRLVALEHGGHDAFAARVSHELTAIAEQPARWHKELQTNAILTDMCSSEPRRRPIFSMTAPAEACGVSTTRRSIGSHFTPSISR